MITIDPVATTGLLPEIRSGFRDGATTKIAIARRTYPTDQADLWDALTDAERIPRWFLPISGDLTVGGRYQLEGQAGGVVERCGCGSRRSRYVGVRRHGLVARSHAHTGRRRYHARVGPRGACRSRSVGTVRSWCGWRRLGPALLGLGLHIESGARVDPKTLPRSPPRLTASSSYRGAAGGLGRRRRRRRRGAWSGARGGRTNGGLLHNCAQGRSRELVDGVFQALGEPVRRRILELLAAGEQPAGAVVGALQAVAPISQPAVSQHLKVLRGARLVTVRAEAPAGSTRSTNPDLAPHRRGSPNWPTRSGRSPSRSTRSRPRSHAAGGRVELCPSHNPRSPPATRRTGSPNRRRRSC